MATRHIQQSPADQGTIIHCNDKHTIAITGMLRYYGASSVVHALEVPCICDSACSHALGESIVESILIVACTVVMVNERELLHKCTHK